MNVDPGTLAFGPSKVGVPFQCALGVLRRVIGLRGIAFLGQSDVMPKFHE